MVSLGMATVNVSATIPIENALKIERCKGNTTISKATRYLLGYVMAQPDEVISRLIEEGEQREKITNSKV